jgi:hypothetical protein
MALNFPSSPIGGQQYTDDNGIVWQYSSAKGVWNVYRDDALKEFSGAKILLDTNEALTSILTAVTFDSEDFDIGGYFSISFPTRLTISRPGFYRLNLLIIAGALGSGASYTFAVKKNGSTTLTTTTAGANQSISYDEIVELVTGDYVELYASESEGVGEIELDSFFEIQNIGDEIGSAQSTATKFSGLKLNLTSIESLTSLLSPITWDSTEFNTNADINGNVYWTAISSSRATIYTTGYYRVKAFFEAGSLGSVDSYTIDLRFNNTSSASSSLSPNDTLDFDDVYNFISGSYIEFLASESGGVGEITTNTFFELIRLGV